MKKLQYLKINNRRYLGNKYKLLSSIVSTINSKCGRINSVADIFAGTGSFASAYQNKIVITNDILYSNYICNLAWFGSEKYSKAKIEKIAVSYNNINGLTENYVSKNFADTYFSKNDCMKIGFIREDVEKMFYEKKINVRERAILLSSLLYSMDQIANTCGHYDAYIKKVRPKDSFIFKVLDAPNDNNKKNKCYNIDTNDLIKKIKADLVYIDPPYNSRQYCDAYHLLENIARWDKPKVFGIAKKMNRNLLKSKYCTKEAKNAFQDLINNVDSKFIVLSYNNTGSSANERSNARISDKDITQILNIKGKTEVYSFKYKSFTTGKSRNSNNKERIFICEVGKK